MGSWFNMPKVIPEAIFCLLKGGLCICMYIHMYMCLSGVRVVNHWIMGSGRSRCTLGVAEYVTIR